MTVPKLHKLKTIEMEIALSTHFNFRQNLIVPNVSWGLYLKGYKMLHECDLLICTKTGYLWECEIKITKADLIKDKKKWHGHRHAAIKRLYFAIPHYLQDCIEIIPKRAGIISVERGKDRYICREKRKPKYQKGHRLTDQERLKLSILGTMRIWNIKKSLLKNDLF